MSVKQRHIFGPDDRERTAIVAIPIPASGKVEIDRTWRFLGWRDEMKVKVKREPFRMSIFPSGLGGDESDDPIPAPPEDDD